MKSPKKRLNLVSQVKTLFGAKFPQRRGERKSSETQLQIEALEPRMMLNGDAGELIFQAGFEDASVPAGQYGFFREVSGMTATGNKVEVQNNHPAVGPAAEGNMHLELDGTNGVFVEISNVPADGLLLQGEYSPRRGFDATQNTIEVLWNGSVVETLSANGKRLRSTKFETFEITLPGVSGTSTSGRLEFRSTTVNDAFGAGGLLDDIKVFKFKQENESPILQTIGDQSIDEGQTLDIQLVATDPDSTQAQLRYTAIQIPGGSTLDPVTGQFSWTPPASAAGLRFNIKVGVTDQSGLTDSQSFRVTVNDVVQNQSPVISPISDLSVNVGQTATVQVVATDPDSDPGQLQYSGIQIPQGSTFDTTTGLFRWTPPSSAVDQQFTIRVGVSDNTGLTDVETFRISVTQDVVNVPPDLNPIADQSTDVGQTLSLQFVATDPSGDPDQLRFSGVQIPVGSTLDPVTGEFNWTPNRFAAGLRFNIKVGVTSETGLTDVETFRITVNNVATGNAPVLTPISDRTIKENETLRIQLSATDPDSEQSQLTYDSIRFPVGGTLDPVTGELVWTPNNYAGGFRFGIDVRVTDESGLSDTKTFRVTVENLNEAPVLVAIADQTVSRNSQLVFTASATDIDRPSETLTFALAGSVPAGAAIDATTGRFTWTPTDATPVGDYSMTVVVSDDNGNEDSQAFNVNVTDGVDDAVELVEGTNFETIAERAIEITADTKQLSFNYETDFDLTDVEFINDAFEVAFLDEEGKSLVHSIGSNRDAFFNFTEEESVSTGVNTEVDGATVKLDLSHIAIGTTANLVFRLVNNDDDTNTQVRVTSIATSSDLMVTPVGAVAESVGQRDLRGINFDLLSDVTGSLEIDYGQTSFNRSTDSLYSQIELTNIGQVSIAGRMLAVFDNPSSELIQLIRPEGRLPDGRFYIELTSETGVLAAGETTRTRDLVLLNPDSELFDFDLTILAEVNAAPTGFTSTPPTDIEAGNTIQYTAVAEDPNADQPLKYSVVTGHENVAINEDTGELNWPTTIDEIGSHVVTVRATDPFGLYVEQTFTIEVHETLQNRPPVFTTNPVTDATASSGFEITTIATGDNPNGVGVVSGFQGPRIVTINSNDQTVGIYEGSGNDRFDDETTYSTGEPARTGNFLQGGYTVDVGLPPFLMSTDSNRILGVDQADFNGDGIVDLISLTYHRSNALRDGYFHDVVLNLGDGNGGFGEPIIVEQFNFGAFALFENFRAADINGDGATDFLWLYNTISSSNPESFVYSALGNGDGTFSAVSNFEVENRLGDFRVVDLDQDGNVDLVGRRAFVDDIGWLKGVGDGTFEEFVSLSPDDTFTSLFNDRARAFQVVDIDRDGDLDIVQARRVSQGIQVLTNDGSLNFSETDVLGAFGSFTMYQGLKVADFTGDGFVDIFFSTWNTGSLNGTRFYMFKGTADGFEDTSVVASTKIPLLGPGNQAGDDRPVDIDGDGDLDILIGHTNASPSQNNGARVLINDGTGFFTDVGFSAAVDPNGQSNPDNQSSQTFTAGVLSGDYNRDGVVDLVVFDSGGAGFESVSVLLGTRPGEFSASQTLTFGEDTPGDIEVVVADFNNDGLNDVLRLGGGMISLGNGDGTFAEPFQATPGRVGDHAVLADFNNDGNLDLLMAAGGRGSGSISGFHQVMLGNGDGTFEQSYLELTAAFNYGSAVLRVADLNNDGYQDFIAKSGLFGVVEALLNDPANPGTFTTPYVLNLDSNYGSAMDIGDFNEDGIVDFVTVEKPTSTGTDIDNRVRLQTYTGIGDGTFELTNEEFDFPGGLTTVFDSNLMLHTGDVNNDGHLDVVNFGFNGNLVHLGNGEGTFAKPIIGFTDTGSTSGSFGITTRLVDIDEDGNLDLVRLHNTSSASIHRGNGDGTFAVPERYKFIQVYGTLRIADLDHDGHLDLIARAFSGNASTIPHSNVLYGARDGLVDVISVDLNGDGNEEILAINEDNDRLKIFEGDNLGGLTRLNDVLVGRAPRAVATADLNGDGTLELITANRAGGSISVLTGNLESGYSAQDFAVEGAPVDVEVTDLNGDGNADIVVLDEFNNALWVFAGNGTTTLDAPVAVALGDAASRFVLADANNDGNIDAVVTLPESNRVMILGGDGSGGFDSPVYVDVESAPSDVAVVDLNEDGNADLAITLPESGVLSVHYGLGGSQFARAQQITVGDTPTRVTTADADEDGRVDLIVTNSGDDTASVIFNRFDPNEVYRYDADAIDPDGDDLDYSVVDGPGGLFIDSTTGEVVWAASPDQVGLHTVILEANDGNGGVATQQFVIDVQPSTENSAPLIATEPIATIGANESFEYRVNSIDDNDSLHYRIIDGPEGATIDPVTGLLQWDGRTDAAVKLGYAGSRTKGEIAIPADESLEPENISVEGWYNFHVLTTDRGTLSSMILIRHDHMPSVFTRVLMYELRIEANRDLVLEFQYDDGESYQLRTPFAVAETDRWYHFAFTFDDATREATIYANGEALASGITPASINYVGSDAQVGESSSSATYATIDNYRIWNVARSAAEIQEGMSRQYENNDQIVLDYRFEDNNTISVRDHSSSENTGFLRPAGTRPIPAPGLANAGIHSFTIGVEDGRGGMTTQTFNVEIVPELRGEIVGHLFDDIDGNGTQETLGEGPLEGWQVYVDANNNSFADPDELQAITDAGGNYRFDRLLPGSYQLRVSPMAGFETPVIGDVVVVANQETAVETAAVAFSLSQIRGSLLTEDGTDIGYWSVYVDSNDNGTRDDGEAFAISDRNGDYAISGLAAGTYTIRTESPAGWNEANDGDGLTVTIGADEVSSGNDFTLAPTNTSVTGGVHFVTTAPTQVTARDTYRYASVATVIGDATISYDISLAPEGLSIDPNTGQVAWNPTATHVGDHLVILRATASDGSISLHDFTITVAAPNAAPAFSNTPPVNAFVGLTFAHNIVAQDSESDELTFALVNGPASATVDTTTGELRWTPVAGDVGTADFEIEVRDTFGNATTQLFIVNVSADQPTATPFTIESPRTEVGLGQDYFARVVGADQLDRPLAWSLTSGPTGFTVAADGTLQWKPSSADLGEQTIELLATDVDGGTESFEFALDVVGRPVISAPVIDSTPMLSTVIGTEYVYDVVVTDANNDPISFALVEAPIGMSINAALGTIRWTPAADQLGEADVIVEVTDPDGASTTQAFTLKVSRAGGPPIITSTPTTEVNVGGSYLYSVLANDAEGDPLTYRLLTAPAGATINETTGEVSWTPTAGQIGQQTIVIEVSDGIGGAATQGFAILVGDGIVNLAPEITTTAPRFSSVGANYEYQLAATDPEGTAITYSVARGPAGLNIDANGLVTWTPTAAQTGQFVVTLVATDAGGASAIESFELDVLAENRLPIINSTAPTEMFAGEEFRYDVLVSDADADQLTFELVGGPVGSTIDAFGRIRWATGNDLIGQHDFEIKISDPRGGEATQSFTLDVVADTKAPVLLLSDLNNEDGRNILPWQGPIRIFARATDNVGIASLVVTANGVDLPLDGSGIASLEFDDYLFNGITIVAVATDVNGNVTTKAITVDYDYPEGWTGAGAEEIPTAIISSPADNGAAVGIVSIQGSALHENFESYQLSFRNKDDSEFTEILSSNTEVDNGELGVWDTSYLRNDNYVIRLEVTTNNGVVNVVENLVGLSGDFKIGHYQQTFVDAEVKLAGMPIQIFRTYDSLSSQQVGDFGFGWSLGVWEADLAVDLPASGLEDIGIYTPFEVGTRVYLTLPNGQREGFTFAPVLKTLPGLGPDLTVASPRFVSDSGVTSKLSAGGGQLTVNERGQLFAVGGLPWNPASPDFAGFQLTASDGTVFAIDGNTGDVTSATIVNGDSLTFSESGIVSSTGSSIDFVRDAAGRISSIIDALGNTASYRYDGAGDLVEFVDLNGNATTMTYSDEAAHYLEDVIDPLGRTVQRSEYDDKGRLVRLVDNGGTTIEFTHAPTDGIQTVTDPLGYESTYFYDSRGNVTGLVDAEGGVSRFTYDDQSNLLSETNPNNETTTYTYNSRGEVLTITDASGGIQRFSYNELGLQTTITDQLGNSTAMEYDENGNLIEVTDSLGATNTFVFNENNDRVSSTDERGNTTQFVYEDRVMVGIITSEGVLRSIERDANGRILGESYEVETLGGTITQDSTLAYDNLGQIVGYENGSNGASSSATIDAAGQVIGSTNVAGGIQTIGYDSRGNAESFSDGQKSSISTTNDALGRPTLTEFSNGLQVVQEYDGLGRIVSETINGGTPASIQYDGVGRVESRVNEFGVETKYEYDLAGNLAKKTLSTGAEIEYEYDAANRNTKITSDGEVTSFTYDVVGRLTRIDFPDGTSSQADYDAAGNVVFEKTRQGLEWRYNYDNLGVLTSTTDVLGNQSFFGRDSAGEIDSITDNLGRTTSIILNEFNELERKTLPLGQVQTYIYNDVGILVEQVSFDGDSLFFDYDEDLRLVSVKDVDGNVIEQWDYIGNETRVTTPHGVASETRNAEGLPEVRVSTNGATTRIGYTEGAVTSVETINGTNSFEYVDQGDIFRDTNINGDITDTKYDEFGFIDETLFSDGSKIKRVHDSEGRLETVTLLDSADILIYEINYIRDSFNRISQTSDSEGSVRDFTYDVLGRLVTEVVNQSGVTTTLGYQYDATGNRIGSSRNGVSLSSTFDGNDRVQTNGVWDYEFDDSGNMTRRSNGTVTENFVYDLRQKLIRVDRTGDSGVSTILYEYDQNGYLSKRTADGVAELYVWNYDASQFPVLLEVQNEDGDLIHRYDHNGTSYTAVYDSQGNASRLLVDQNNSIRAILSESGLELIDYDAFGTLLSQNSLSIGFGGGIFDSTTKLNYLGSRWYDDTNGRFTQQDSDPGSFQDSRLSNRYVYALGDPVNLIDPLGQRASLSEVITVMGIGASILGFGAFVAPRETAVLLSNGRADFSPQTAVNRPFFEFGVGKTTGRAKGRVTANAGFGLIGGIEKLSFGSKSQVEGDDSIYLYLGGTLGANLTAKLAGKKGGDPDSLDTISARLSGAKGKVFDTFVTNDYNGPFFGVSGGFSVNISLGKLPIDIAPGRVNAVAWSLFAIDSDPDEYAHSFTVFSLGLPGANNLNGFNVNFTVKGGVSLTYYSNFEFLG